MRRDGIGSSLVERMGWMLAGDEDSERRDPIPWQEQLVKNICRITMPASPTWSSFLQIRQLPTDPSLEVASVAEGPSQGARSVRMGLAVSC
jgi:hypothetical protein